MTSAFKKYLFAVCALLVFFTTSVGGGAHPAEAGEADIPLTAVRILYSGTVYRARLRHVKTPANANGTFSYSWSSGSAAVNLSPNGGEAILTVSRPASAIPVTLTVTQTMPSGARVQRSHTIHFQYMRPSASSSGDSGGGCAVASVYALALLLVLPLLIKKRSKNLENV